MIKTGEWELVYRDGPMGQKWISFWDSDGERKTAPKNLLHKVRTQQPKYPGYYHMG